MSRRTYVERIRSVCETDRVGHVRRKRVRQQVRGPNLGPRVSPTVTQCDVGTEPSVGGRHLVSSVYVGPSLRVRHVHVLREAQWSRRVIQTCCIGDGDGWAVYACITRTKHRVTYVVRTQGRFRVRRTTAKWACVMWTLLP